MRDKKVTIPLPAAAVIAVGVFAALLSRAFFVREDFTYLEMARYLMRAPSDFFTTSFSQGLWFRQFTILFWKLCWMAFGLNPAANYIINAAVLLATALVAAALARRLGAGAFASSLAALLFVVHPIAVETASYLAARADVIGAFFALCALCFHHLSFRSTRRFAFTVLAAFLALISCLCKEMFITLPFLILLFPYSDKGGERQVGVVIRIGKSLPCFVAVAIFTLWRTAVIGSLLGGYMYKRTSMMETLMRFPLNAAHTIVESARMVLGITYESVLFRWHFAAAMVVALAFGSWLLVSRRRPLTKAHFLLIAWVAISIAPILNMADIIRYSPRLMYFPFLLILILLARLFPAEVRLRDCIAPALMLIAWVPISWTVVNARLAEGEMHRKLAAAMLDYYLPRALREPPNQYKIIFGAPPPMFTLDEMFDSVAPENMDYISSSPATFKFLFGDRMNRVAFVYTKGANCEKRAYRDKWDYETRERFLAYKDDLVAVETYRAPDILRLMREGKGVEVSAYNPERGTLKDITLKFRRLLTEREGKRADFIRWSFRDEATGWKLSPQLKQNAGSAMRFTSTGNDPFLIRNIKEGINPLLYTYIEIDMAVEKGGVFGQQIMTGSISWDSDSKPPYGLALHIEFPVRADGKRRVYGVKIGRWPGWYLSGEIKSLRIDPIDAPGKLRIYTITLVPNMVQEGSSPFFYSHEFE